MRARCLAGMAAAAAFAAACNDTTQPNGPGSVGPDGGPPVGGGPSSDGGPPPASRFSLIIQVNGNGSVTAAGATCHGQCTIPVDAGARVHLIATPDTGNLFTGWSGACTGTGTCDLAMTSDQQVTASFGPVASPTLRMLTVAIDGQGRVTSTPPGIDCPGTCAAAFDLGSSVSLSALPAAGQAFAGWSGACSGTGPCKVTMNVPEAVGVRFEAQPPPPPDACAGLGPQPVGPQDLSLGVNPQTCQPGAGDGNGFLLFTARRTDNPGQGTMQLFAPRTGAVSFGQFFDTTFRIFSEPVGFDALGSRSSQGFLYMQFFDGQGRAADNGAPLQHAGDAWPAADPTGGLMIAGDLGFIGPGFTHSPTLFSYGSTAGQLTRWNRPLSSRGPVVGIGVDVSGNTLVLTDGAAAFGAGSISAEWFDRAGNGSGEFLFISGFSPGSSTWFQLAPLIGGGLAVARFDGSGPHGTTSRWIGTAASLQRRAMDPAPSWLSTRFDTWIEIVRGGKAYAVLPLGRAGATCAPLVEVVVPSGQVCGSHALFLAPGTCDTFDVTAGKDGTLMTELPDSMERFTSAGRSCTWRTWREELR